MSKEPMIGFFKDKISGAFWKLGMSWIFCSEIQMSKESVSK
jgi:hypothetical protein